MCSGKRLTFVHVLGNHAACSERKEAADGFGASDKFIRGRGRAPGVDVGIEDRGHCLMQVQGVFAWEFVGECGESCNRTLSYCENVTFYSGSVFSRRRCLELYTKRAQRAG